VREQDFVPLCCGSLVKQQEILVRWPFGALRLAGNVNDPPTWCGAAWTTLCGGRGDPHPLWRSSLVESGAKVTGNLAQALVASQGIPKRDLVAEKRYS